jgi:hypothetical protein
MALRDALNTAESVLLYYLGAARAYRDLHLQAARDYAVRGQRADAAIEIALARAAQRRAISALRSLREYRAAGDRRTA